MHSAYLNLYMECLWELLQDASGSSINEILLKTGWRFEEVTQR